MSDYAVERVRLTFHYANAAGDAFTIEGSLDPELGWLQWGQPRERLAENVGLIEALAQTLREASLIPAS